MIYTIIIAIVILIVVIAIFSYNKMVKNKNRMLEAWSIIDVFLKKRHDLIPNLVDIVKSYANYEKNTLNEITQKRAAALSADSQHAQIAAETNLSNSLSNFFVSVEAYPELKASANFLDLQKTMTDVEVELERARRYYNGTVREYNIFLQTFPYNLFATLFGFGKGEFFSIDAHEKDVPDVSMQ